MRNRPFTLAYVVMLMLGIADPAAAQDHGAQQPSARQQLQHIHTPQSIDRELAPLTKDMELTPEQQKQDRALLEDHHDRIQALLDKNPTSSRQELYLVLIQAADILPNLYGRVFVPPAVKAELAHANSLMKF